MKELRDSGYNEFDRFRVLKCGVEGYRKLMLKVENNERPFYRNHKYQRTKRYKDKIAKKNNWYKSKCDKYKSVIFVDPTPNSLLLKMLKSTEDRHKINENCRIKFVEKSGVKYVDYLKNVNPFGENCKKEDDCLMCRNNQKFTNCKTENVGYTIKCKLCKERQIVKTYEGETARNGHIRGKEHLKGWQNKSKNSVLYRHIQTDHKDEVELVDYEMKITGKFKTSLSRQIDEGIRIKNRKPEELLNSKAEFFRPCV